MRQFGKIAMCLILVCMMVGAVSCSKKKETATEEKSLEPVSITFAIWDKKQKPAMEEMVGAYTKAHPNVSIEILLTPYKEYWTKLEAAMVGGKGPDVFWYNVLHADDYINAGIVADLTPYIKKSDILKSFPKNLVENYAREGKYYAVPKDFDTNALWFNKEIFDNLGVAYPTNDMSVADLKAKAQELVDAGLPEGYYPFAAPIDFQTWYYQTVYANGGYIVNADKTATGYAKPETAAGIQCWIDFIEEGLSPSLEVMSETWPDVIFEAGQLAMNLAGSYMVPSYSQNELIRDKIDCVELPTYNGQKTNCINGLGYGVYENSKNKAAAIDFALWLGSSEAMAIQGKSGSVISARTDAQKYFAEANPKYNLKAYTVHADKAYPLPVANNILEIYRLESKMLQDAYGLKRPLTEVLAELQVEADKLIKKRR